MLCHCVRRERSNNRDEAAVLSNGHAAQAVRAGVGILRVSLSLLVVKQVCRTSLVGADHLKCTLVGLDE